MAERNVKLRLKPNVKNSLHFIVNFSKENRYLYKYTKYIIITMETNKESKARLYDVMKDVELLIKLSKEEPVWRLGLNINSKLREIIGEL